MGYKTAKENFVNFKLEIYIHEEGLPLSEKRRQLLLLLHDRSCRPSDAGPPQIHFSLKISLRWQWQ